MVMPDGYATPPARTMQNGHEQGMLFKGVLSKKRTMSPRTSHRQIDRSPLACVGCLLGNWLLRPGCCKWELKLYMHSLRACCSTGHCKTCGTYSCQLGVSLSRSHVGVTRYMACRSVPVTSPHVRARSRSVRRRHDFKARDSR